MCSSDLLPAQDVPQGRCDRWGGQSRGGDLVQQWLEGMVVVPVDQHDVGRRPPQRAHGPQSGEAPADDDDARSFAGGGGVLHVQAMVTPELLKGRSYSGLPVSCAIALATAGAMGGVPGSPTPVGALVEGTMCTSIFGIWLMRSTG